MQCNPVQEDMDDKHLLFTLAKVNKLNADLSYMSDFGRICADLQRNNRTKYSFFGMFV